LSGFSSCEIEVNSALANLIVQSLTLTEMLESASDWDQAHSGAWPIHSRDDVFEQVTIAQ
jgi:hypothetical protein